MGRLDGKVALVTGSARGIGKGIATELAKQGADIIVADILIDLAFQTAGELQNRHGVTTLALEMDVTSDDSISTNLEQGIAEMGRIDILVNNAGYVVYRKFIETGPDEWKAQIDTCLYGAIHCCHAVAPHMIEREGGRIVNVVGDSWRVGEANLARAAAARGSTIALAKSLARELGPSNVCVNTLSLGLVRTTHSDADFLERNMDRIVRAYPLHRIGVLDDVAPMVAFLASDEASWITGQTISVNGSFAMV